MPSPFPGMDPYLERHWGDVHHAFITYARDQVQEVLPHNLHARLEERVFVEAAVGYDRPIYPDFRVIASRQHGKGKPAKTGSLIAAEPLVIRLSNEPAIQGFIEIIDKGSGDRVVTIVELLSPSNKLPGEGRKLYQSKQEECRDARVNLVEIDLVRTGRRLLMVSEDQIPVSHRTLYQVCVYRSWNHAALGEIYPVPLQKRLPIIKIPLRRRDTDVPLDMQAVLDQCYRNGRYGDSIDYTKEPMPPLEPDDARWADELLRKKGIRKGKSARRNGRNDKRRRSS